MGPSLLIVFLLYGSFFWCIFSVFLFDLLNFQIPTLNFGCPFIIFISFLTWKSSCCRISNPQCWLLHLCYFFICGTDSLILVSCFSTHVADSHPFSRPCCHLIPVADTLWHIYVLDFLMCLAELLICFAKIFNHVSAFIYHIFSYPFFSDFLVDSPNFILQVLSFLFSGFIAGGLFLFKLFPCLYLF